MDLVRFAKVLDGRPHRRRIADSLQGRAVVNVRHPSVRSGARDLDLRPRVACRAGSPAAPGDARGFAKLDEHPIHSLPLRSLPALHSSTHPLVPGNYLVRIGHQDLSFEVIVVPVYPGA